jgi:hypothetical protein
VQVSEHTRIQATSDQLSTHLEGGSFVLDLSDGIYYRLNEVAGRMWELLTKPTTIAQISVQIAAEYDVDESQCTKDLLDVGQQLADLGLITTVDE